jgi:acetolactate synthase-1/2/3 large subunit
VNGAESLAHTLVGSGIEVCFANPGTSEMHFVAALDRIPRIRCVLGLHENVATGCADGYWRMAGKPAATLLHCGPGLANGLANLHNARRACSGIVNIVGDQATYHRPLDPPLTADTEGWARGVSAWVRTAASAATVGADAAMAVQVARTSPGQVATLVLPADTTWDEGGAVAPALGVPPAPRPDPHAVRSAARGLREKRDALLLLGGAALGERAQLLAHRIAAATGCRLLAETFNARVARGRGRPQVERVPYVADLAVEALKGVDHLILAGSGPPVGFFAYPGKPGLYHPPTAQVHVLARPEHDVEAALLALAGGARTVAALMPEGAIVADESITFGRDFFKETHAAPPHAWLQVAGGAIGGGMPLATGAVLGAPGRRVINLQADGSAMYTVQALWTQARERLPVTTVVLSNRKYAILLAEYRNVGANPGRTALDMMDLGDPGLDWVRIAGGMGVEAARAETLEACADLLAGSFSRPGPFLVELVI